MMPLIPPIRLEIKSWGFAWGDIAFGTGMQILVSEKLKSQFLAEGLDGITRFDSVEIVRAKRNKSVETTFPTYYLASIKISRAAIDELSSGLVRDETLVCNECRVGRVIKRIDKIILEPDTPPTEDIFIARGLPGTILVSERFKLVCEMDKLLNCSFVPAEEFSFDFYPNEKL